MLRAIALAMLLILALGGPGLVAPGGHRDGQAAFSRLEIAKHALVRFERPLRLSVTAPKPRPLTVMSVPWLTALGTMCALAALGVASNQSASRSRVARPIHRPRARSSLEPPPTH